MDLKDILRIALHPLTLAALGGYGGRYAKRKYKVKVPEVVAMGGGAVVGYALGKMIAPHLAAPPALPPPAATVAQNGYAGARPHPDLVDLVFNQPRALPPAGGNVLDDLSDLSPSYNKTSYDTDDVDDLVSEGEEDLRSRRS